MKHFDDHSNIIDLAQRHGLDLVEVSQVNEMGLDFKVAIAPASDGKDWVLRVPRRANVLPRATYEQKALQFLQSRLPVQIPDWRIFSEELIAYQLLPGKPALSFDASYNVTWNMDQAAPAYPRTLGESIAALHRIATSDAQKAGIEVLNAEAFRQDMANKLQTVTREIGIDGQLEAQLKIWLANDVLWPKFSTCTHGDLYAGHVLVNDVAEAIGIIDWTETRVSDPSIDFTGHYTVFGAQSLERLISEYAAAGGQTWPRMAEHIAQRSAAAPVLYGIFALSSGDPQHLEAAKAQLLTRN